jgi:hypothetical protein
MDTSAPHRQLKMLGSCFLAAISAGVASGVRVETVHAMDLGFGPFTGPQGREMQAKLTAVSGDDVFIDRQDGLMTKVDVFYAMMIQS